MNSLFVVHLFFFHMTMNREMMLGMIKASKTGNDMLQVLDLIVNEYTSDESNDENEISEIETQEVMI